MFEVHGYFKNAKATLESEYLDVVVGEFMEYLGDNVECDIVDMSTGEVLAYHTHENDYCTDCVALMIVGLLALNAWGE